MATSGSDELYSFIKNYHKSRRYEESGKTVNTKYLAPTLREYQVDAVKWMLSRESDCGKDAPAPFEGQEVVYPQGGILADEMGLGKTVEVLACILSNPFEELVDVVTVKSETKVSNTEEVTKDEKTEAPLLETKPLVNGDLFDFGMSQNDPMEVENDDDCSSSDDEIKPTVRKTPIVISDEEVEQESSTQEPTDQEESEDDMSLSERLKKSNFQESKVRSKPKRRKSSSARRLKTKSEDKSYASTTKILNTESSRSRRNQRRLDYTVYDYDSDVDYDSKYSEDYAPPRKKRVQAARPKKKNTNKNKAVLKILKPQLVSSTEEDKTDQDPVASVIEYVIKNYGLTPKEKEELNNPPRKRTGIKNEKYASLTKWYELELSGCSNARSSVYEDPKLKKLQCFCNSRRTTNLVECVRCGKFQHFRCVTPTNDENQDEEEVPGLLKYTEDHEYMCPWCWEKEESIQAKTTFIVSPASISSQWETEIARHITKPGWKVLFYTGVKAGTYVSPKQLSSYDIVITTYNILCSEIDFLKSNNEKELRHSRRYFSPVSPLTRVHWWRICLDEAQTVEGFLTKTALMAQELTGVHLWAVTGTPIQRSIEDLAGLMKFLKVQPFSDSWYWSQLMSNTSELYKYVAPILWRSRKNDVLESLGVPPQSQVYHNLHFSPVETYFYGRTHNECTNNFRCKLSKFPNLGVPLNSLDRKSMNSLLGPLLKLRQACIHPQAVRGKFTRIKGGMTMGALLDAMLVKAKLDVEVALRQLVSSLNGLAAMDIIDQWYIPAAEKYRQVLALATEQPGGVKVDTLQMIHCLYNLSECLLLHGDVIPPTLRDGELKKEAEQLEMEYLKKYELKIQAAQAKMDEFTSTVAQLSSGHTLGFTGWWKTALNWVGADQQADLIQRIGSFLNDHAVSGQHKFSQHKLQDKFRNVPAVFRQLATWLANADTARIRALDAMRNLSVVSVSTLAAEALNCHLRTKQKKKKCTICQTEIVLLMYEVAIFSIDQKSIADDSSDSDESIDVDDSKPTENSNSASSRQVAQLKKDNLFKHKKEGSWKYTYTEGVLQVIANFCKTRGADPKWIEDAAKHASILEAVRKEFKSIRCVWRYISDMASAYDELGMAKTRLRLVLPTEEEDFRKKKIKDAHIISPEEMPMHFRKLELDFEVARTDLKKYSGILVYLKSLSKEDPKSESQEVCPVCHDSLLEKWSVLECIHKICFCCMTHMLKTNSGNYIECPLCRVKTQNADISYVLRNVDESKEDEDGPRVRGSHSTKVGAVVAEVLKLKAEEPTVKILVFSYWAKVLELIAEALDVNDISHKQLMTGADFKTNLNQFKTGNITVLLITLNWGSKGLNLVEATHVFLVEPVLNPADELQAVGRVHRIGQTKPTVVHKFVVNETIEQKMVAALEVDAAEWVNGGVLLSQLQELFFINEGEEVDVVG